MSRRARHRPFRPAVEALEARTLLSVCTVDRLNDLDEGKSGRGSLRYCVIESLFRADTINFEVTGVINLTNPLPTLVRSVSIEGPGASLMTVRRSTGGTYRIFTIPADVTVRLAGLTISNGSAGDAGGVSNAGVLTVSSSIVSGNRADVAARGGGIFNSGTLTVSSSTITGNTAVAGRGAGIYNLGGTLTVTNSEISSNTATGAGAGGGIFNTGTLILRNSTVWGNSVTSSGDGGGIFNDGTATVSGSTIGGNLASFGGGIDNRRGLIVSNSTVSTNNAAYGGGIENRGTLALAHSTVTGNSSASFGRGGGISVTGVMTTRNTIIAGNTGINGPDVFGNFGSQGYNLLGNPQEASGWVATDLLHVNPRLGPIVNNGGPTITHALMPGSPAINAAGFQLGFLKWDQRGPGFYRIAGGRLDIGAFEVQGRSGEGALQDDGLTPTLGFDLSLLDDQPTRGSRANLSRPDRV